MDNQDLSKLERCFQNTNETELFAEKRYFYRISYVVKIECEDTVVHQVGITSDFDTYTEATDFCINNFIPEKYIQQIEQKHHYEVNKPEPDEMETWEEWHADDMADYSNGGAGLGHEYGILGNYTTDDF